MPATPHAPRSAATARVALRASPEAKALIELAAAQMGISVSAFVTQHAYAAAERILADHASRSQVQKDLAVFGAA